MLREYDLTEGTGLLFQSLQPAESKGRLKENHSFVEVLGNSPFIFLETKNNPQEGLCPLGKNYGFRVNSFLHWGQRGMGTRENDFMEKPILPKAGGPASPDP